MTLNDLIRKANGVAQQFSSGDLDLMLLDAITADAHGIPVKDIQINHYSEDGKMRVQIYFETLEPSRRITADDRVAQIRNRMLATGSDPFADRSRKAGKVAARHCVFLMLKGEGFTLHEIARATGFDHSTVVWGIRHARDLIGVGDWLYKQTWNLINLMAI